MMEMPEALRDPRFKRGEILYFSSEVFGEHINERNEFILRVK